MRDEVVHMTVLLLLGMSCGVAGARSDCTCISCSIVGARFAVDEGIATGISRSRSHGEVFRWSEGDTIGSEQCFEVGHARFQVEHVTAESGR